MGRSRGGGPADRSARISKVNAFIVHARNYSIDDPSPTGIRAWAEKLPLPAVASQEYTVSECLKTCGRQIIGDRDILREGRNRAGALLQEFHGRPTNALLWFVSWLSFLMFLSSLAMVIVSHILLIFDGAILPMWYLRQSCTDASWGKEVAVLSCGLSALFLALLVAIVVLLPFVLRIQWQWAQVEVMGHLPAAFFTNAIIAEIRKRFMIESFLRARLGNNLSRAVLELLPEPPPAMNNGPPAVNNDGQ